LEDPGVARSVAQDYVASADLLRTQSEDGRTGLVMSKGFIRAKAVGCGLSLLKRSVFERMRAAFPDLAAAPHPAYQSLGVKSEVFQPFEALADADGIYVSEDIAFCRRWIDGCGGQIWANVEETITHLGRTAFSGRYTDRLTYPDMK
jgi:hypothetical protein